MNKNLDKLWLDLARRVALESKDPITKVGSVIVSPDQRQCSVGYNGFPTKVEETELKWSRPEKYEWVIHSEMNNLLNCPFPTKGASMYITHKPCHKCLLHLVQAGITNVYYIFDYTNTRQDIIEELKNHINLEQMYIFGERSMGHLSECHPDLQLIFTTVIKMSLVDFSITEGHRSQEEQLELFKQGRELRDGKWVVVDESKIVTKKDGSDKASKHNEKPSKALDIMVHHPDAKLRRVLAYDAAHMGYIAGLALAIAAKLKEEGKITHDLKWGGTFGAVNGTIQGWDSPHFELV